jgi:hypothetical protein
MIFRRAVTQLLKKFLMLLSIGFRVRSKETALAIWRRPADCVELMIAKYGERRPGFAHGPRDPQDFSFFSNLRSGSACP